MPLVIRGITEAPYRIDRLGSKKGASSSMAYIIGLERSGEKVTLAWPVLCRWSSTAVRYNGPP